ncbi:MAG: hypothetical protein IT379_08645 [Deltaproteobacteria bacterium]|nr:hypothetical protein [Deltaproteobacteria bacterium]
MTAVAIPAVGDHHACTVIGLDGELWCWGSNSSGQLGLDPSTTPSALLPTRIPGMTGVGSVCAADMHTCVTFRSGAVRCWGANDAGQLGVLPTGPGGYLPVDAGINGTAVGVSCSQASTCARMFDGSVQCWGYNDLGQAGNGTFDTPAPPGPVRGLSGEYAIQVVVGTWFACAVLDSGGVMCWGFNEDAQLGDESFEHRPGAVRVRGLR